MTSRLDEAYEDLTYLRQYSLESGLYQRVIEADNKLQNQIEEKVLSKISAIKPNSIKVPNNGKLKSNVVCISEGKLDVSEKLKKELTLADFTGKYKTEEVTYIEGFATVIYGVTANSAVGTEVDQSAISSEKIEELEVASYLAMYKLNSDPIDKKQLFHLLFQSNCL